MPSSRTPRSMRLVALIAALLVILNGGVAAAITAPEVPPLSTNGSPPACRIADKTAKFTSASAWSRTLVDWIYSVSSSYKPPSLVPVSRAGLSGGGSVRAEVIPDLKAMAMAARAAGAPVAVESAYRSYASQVASFNMWVVRYGYSTAIIGSARPGHSEHQLGTALDFKSSGGGAPWAIGGYDWTTSRAGRWMVANAWKYGFVLSYPKGKKSEVCYGYEPWHYRYFGRTIARSIHLSGQTTRVWLWRHGNSPITLPQPTPTPTPSASPTPSFGAAPTPSSSPDVPVAPIGSPAASDPVDSPSPPESIAPSAAPSDMPSTDASAEPSTETP